MSTGKVVLGTLAGFALGAIAGILFAPEKGSVTRKQIMDKGDDYVDKLKSKFNEFKGTLTDKYDSAKKEVDGLADKGRAKYEEAKNMGSEQKHIVSR